MKLGWQKTSIVIFLVSMIILLAGCGGGAAVETPTIVLPTRTPFPPSPTPIPTAAIVNGDLITMAEFQEELARYKAAVNRELTPGDENVVLDELINQTLLAQAAASEGYQISEDQLSNRIADLDTENQPLADWLAANGFTEESFRSYLKRSLESAWMRDEIASEVPFEMPQIHVQQMLFYDLDSAEITQDSLEQGYDFAQLAKNHDPQTQGDLGWFPEGFLTIPELDPILFGMEVGEISDIIETEIGYHIFIVLEKEDNRPLDPAIRQILKQKALEDWLERRWKLSTIEISISS
jgi:parvulin-like peptidyl-prolyl isomerase